VDQTDRELPGALTLQQMEQNPKQAEPLAESQDWRKDWYYFRLADKLSYKTDAGGSGRRRLLVASQRLRTQHLHPQQHALRHRFILFGQFSGLV
jgi:hypothetical protein